MYVVVNMDTDGSEYGMKVVGSYETSMEAQAAMHDDVESYVKECEWEAGRWEVSNGQASAYPPSVGIDQDGCPIDQDSCSFWAIFDTDSPDRWNSWMLGTNFWVRDTGV